MTLASTTTTTNPQPAQIAQSVPKTQADWTLILNQLQSWQQMLQSLAPAIDYSNSGNVGYWIQTAAESSAGVTPTNYSYPPGVVDRYGTNTVPGTTDMTTALTNALAAVGNGTVTALAATYFFGANFTLIPSGNGPANIIGAGIDATIFKFANAGDGLYLGGGCNIQGVTFLTTNAGAGTALRLSGFLQKARQIKFSQSGSGIWAVGLKSFGMVTGLLENVYTTTAGCTVGISVESNGVNFTGNLNLHNCEIRGATTGIQFIGAYNVLSAVLVGCAIENCGTNGMLITGGANQAPVISIYGGYFENNGTNDINHQANGDFSIFESNFVTATTNALNFSNAGCTARMRAYGVVVYAQTGGNILLGANIGQSSLIGCTVQGAKLTISTPSRVTLINNFANDSSWLQNFICDDGSGSARLTFRTATDAAQVQVTPGGTLQFSNNGILGLAIDGAGKIYAQVKMFPPQDTGAQQTSFGTYQGTGAPNNANGVNGDIYLRGDTPSTVNQRIYIKSAGSWVGIL